jgi:endonuclease III
MRKDGTAPVDTMGCQISMQDDVASVRVRVCVCVCVCVIIHLQTKRVRTLISLMLSSQTKDAVNHAAMKRLCDAGMADVDGLLQCDENTLAALIKPVSFYTVCACVCNNNYYSYRTKRSIYVRQLRYYIHDTTTIYHKHWSNCVHCQV